MRTNLVPRVSSGASHAEGPGDEVVHVRLSSLTSLLAGFLFLFTNKTQDEGHFIVLLLRSFFSSRNIFALRKGIPGDEVEPEIVGHKYHFSEDIAEQLICFYNSQTFPNFSQMPSELAPSFHEISTCLPYNDGKKKSSLKIRFGREKKSLG